MMSKRSSSITVGGKDYIGYQQKTWEFTGSSVKDVRCQRIIINHKVRRLYSPTFCNDK